MTEAERERTTSQRQVEDLNRQRESITSYLDELRSLLGHEPVPSKAALEKAAKAEAAFSATGAERPAERKPRTAKASPDATGEPTAVSPEARASAESKAGKPAAEKDPITAAAAVAQVDADATIQEIVQEARAAADGTAPAELEDNVADAAEATEKAADTDVVENVAADMTDHSTSQPR
jgi:hypothetical protein